MDVSVLRSRSLRAVLLVLAGLATIWTAPSVSATQVSSSAQVTSQRAALSGFDLTLAPHGATVAPVDHVRTLEAIGSARRPLCGPPDTDARAGGASRRLLHAATRTSGPRAPPLARPA